MIYGVQFEFRAGANLDFIYITYGQNIRIATEMRPPH